MSLKKECPNANTILCIEDYIKKYHIKSEIKKKILKKCHIF